MPHGENHQRNGDEASALRHVLDPEMSEGQRQLCAAESSENPTDEHADVSNPYRITACGKSDRAAFTNCPHGKPPTGTIHEEPERWPNEEAHISHDVMVEQDFPDKRNI